MSLHFSAEHTTLILNDHRVVGFSADADAISFPDLELAQVERGADGLMVVSSTGNKGGQFIIKLMPNSPSTQFFMQQITQIQRGAAIEFGGTINNEVVRVSGRLDRGAIITGPAGQTIGKGSAAAREFIFEFETLLSNYDGANFVAPPQTDALAEAA